MDSLRHDRHAALLEIRLDRVTGLTAEAREALAGRHPDRRARPDRASDDRRALGAPRRGADRDVRRLVADRHPPSPVLPGRTGHAGRRSCRRWPGGPFHSLLIGDDRPRAARARRPGPVGPQRVAAHRRLPYAALRPLASRRSCRPTPARRPATRRRPARPAAVTPTVNRTWPMPGRLVSVSTISPKARGWSTLGTGSCSVPGVGCTNAGARSTVATPPVTVTVPSESAGTAERSRPAVLLGEGRPSSVVQPPPGR